MHSTPDPFARHGTHLSQQNDAILIEIKNLKFFFDVPKSVHHHTIQIN
jgi:hypothetical protein